MYHFFIKEDQILDRTVRIEGSDVNHIRNVLRMKPGEIICVNDGKRTWRCELSQIEADRILASVLEEVPGSELPCRIYLFQGLPKSDKMELIIQKCVELGVSDIIPVAMKRCVMKLDEKKQDTRIRRWQQISESAAKQAGRSLIPTIYAPISYKEAIDRLARLDVRLLPYEHALGMEQTRRILGEIRPGQSIGILIGPEGGFEESEVQKAMEVGSSVITLGKRILRTETAGMAVLSMLTYCLEQD